MDVIRKLNAPAADNTYYAYPDYQTSNVTVHLEAASDGSLLPSSKGNVFTAKTGTSLLGIGQPVKGSAITGYAVYGENKKTGSPRTLIDVYRHPEDTTRLGDYYNGAFFLPSAPYALTDVYIVPLAEFQGLTVKPHPSTKNETITDPSTGETVTYAGRAYLNGAFNGGGSDLVADQDGELYVDKIDSGAVVSLRSIAPEGYVTEWVNGTLDFDEDGVIDNKNAGGMSQSKVDALYIPVYGDRLIYQVNQVNPKYYYRFTKFDPSRLLNGRTRKGYVMYDARSILDYDGKEPQYRDLLPLAGATVMIGSNAAATDESGHYEIPMDGVPDAVRVSAMVRSGMGDFVTHIQSNVENNITLPFYDTFEPTGEISASYKDEGAVLARGIKVADNTLTVSLKVARESGGLYIKKAYFYIADSTGKKVIDCNEKAAAGDSNYQVSYTDGSTYGTATLKINPKADMLSGYQIYVQFEDQNGSLHRAMNTGYRFIEQLNLGTFVLGAIGSPALADGVQTTLDLLGSPLLKMDMGQISGFRTNTALIGPETKLYDERGNVTNQYDATLYSYEWKSTGFGNWTDFKSAGVQALANGEGENGEGETVEHPKNAVLENGEYISRLKNGGANDTENGLPKESDKNQPPKNGAAQEEPQKPKGAALGNDNKGVAVASDYSFDLAPSVQFDLVTTARPITDAQGNQVYKHYFEEMRLAVGVDFDVATRIEISFPIGISLMIQPSLGGSAAAIYYMRTDYGDDKFWTERPIEYSPESFGLFDDFHGNMYRAGYIQLNPVITIDVGVKVAIVKVDVGATVAFDMDFKFDKAGSRTHGSMDYDIHIIVRLLKFKIYSKNLKEQKNIYLFGDREPLDDNITLMTARMNQAVSEALAGGDTAVEAEDRSYLGERGGWNEGRQARLFRANDVLDEDHPADALLQNGVMPGDQMGSAMLDTDVMFVAFVDDDPSRGDNDRGVVKYTYTNSNGTWAEAKPIDPDNRTLDTEPVVYDMGEKLLVAWLSASRTFDGEEDSLNTVAAQLNALDVHAAFFDKSTRTFGQIFEVTKTTDDDHTAEGSLVITAQDNGGARIYYTKTQYGEAPENVNELIATSSVIAYRDYADGAWSAELTQAERSNIQAQGGDVEEYARQLYGQHFADTRINGQWKLVTDMEADYNGEAWTYFAFVADEDGSLETSTDRRVFLLFDQYPAPVCVTPEAGAYDSLQFCYSGSELLLFFKTDHAKATLDGEEKSMGGVSYVNLSEVFEKQGYDSSYDSAGGYYQMTMAGTVDGQATTFLYQPEDAVVLEGMVQNYTVFADQGGRVYVMWNENTVNDDGTSGIQIYTSVYNGNPDWTSGADTDAWAMGAKWSCPVLMTSPLNGSYNSFTAQSIIGDGIAFVAKRTATEDVPQLVFHLRAPYAGFTFGEELMDTKYVYANRPTRLTARITNTGLMAQKAERNENAGNTWKALPGKYRIAFKTLVNGVETEIGAQELEAVWNVGTTLSASCDWVPEEVPDNMDLRVFVTDMDTGKEICSLTQPVVKETALDLGQLEVDTGEARQADVRFMLSNSGNIPAHPAAVIYALDENGNQIQLSSTALPEVAPMENAAESISVKIPENCLTISDGQGTFELLVDIWEDGVFSYSTSASGSIAYSAEAIADIAQVEGLEVDQTSLRMQKEDTAALTARLTPASASQRNRVAYASSDETVAIVDADGNVTAVGNGTATITVCAVPKMEWVSVQPNGSTVFGDMRGAIPDSMVKSQEITVVVSDSGSSSGDSGGSSGNSSSSSGKPTVDKGEGGAVTVNNDGSVVITPDAGYEIKKITVNGKEVEIPADGKLTGLKPSDHVVVTFAKIPTTTAEQQFADVKAGAWYYEAVKFVQERGLMNGYSDGRFGPNDNLSRAQLAQILFNKEGRPVVNYLLTFSDVAGEAWYTEAIRWAASQGIVSGYGDGRFGPNDPITREQLAVMLWRYSGSPSASNKELPFTDAEKISGFALEAMRWAVENGILNGYGDGRLGPQGQATRAQVAQMLKNFIENQEEKT